VHRHRRTIGVVIGGAAAAAASAGWRIAAPRSLAAAAAGWRIAAPRSLARESPRAVPPRRYAVRCVLHLVVRA
jgi:hypothetical protein